VRGAFLGYAQPPVTSAARPLTTPGMEALLVHEGARTELRHDDLFLPFTQAFAPVSAWRVGTEAEKIGVLRGSYAPLPYAGERSVEAVLAALVRRYGWTPEPEYEGGPVISLKRGEASITLEPGGQVELSGAPFASVHDTAREWEGHLDELRSVGDELGITWLGLGFHPFARQAELSWVPKLRYGVMREYLPTRGSMGLDMMRRTCTVQVNLDYASERDAIEKLQLLLAVSPVITAMFANSPWVEGRATGELSHRARVWLNTDPDRTGLLPSMWGREASFERYVEWALDVPMFLVKRHGQLVRNTGQTFRDFMARGFEGATATLDDWVTHLGTLFPEVRLKRTIEVRGADCVPAPLVPALAALAKGLVYAPGARSELAAAVAPLDYEQVRMARVEVGARGLATQLGGRALAHWAVQLVDIAGRGLEALGAGDEQRYLEPLAELMRRGRTPAEELLARIQPGASFEAQVVALSAY
jgi:glutamate--cysteine ligase